MQLSMQWVVTFDEQDKAYMFSCPSDGDEAAIAVLCECSIGSIYCPAASVKQHRFTVLRD